MKWFGFTLGRNVTEMPIIEREGPDFRYGIKCGLYLNLRIGRTLVTVSLIRRPTQLEPFVKGSLSVCSSSASWNEEMIERILHSGTR